MRGTPAVPLQAAVRTALLLVGEIQDHRHHRKRLPQCAAMTGAAGLLTPGATSDAAWDGSSPKGHAAASLALATKESLLEFSHFGFEHVDLSLEFFGPG